MNPAGKRPIALDHIAHARSSEQLVEPGEERARSDLVEHVVGSGLFDLDTVVECRNVDRHEVALVGGAIDLFEIRELVPQRIHLLLDLFFFDHRRLDFDLATVEIRDGVEDRPERDKHVDFDAAAVDVADIGDGRNGRRLEATLVDRGSDRVRNGFFDRLGPEAVGTDHAFDDRTRRLAGPEALDLHLTRDLASGFRLRSFEFGFFELDRQGALKAPRLADLSVHVVSMGIGGTGLWGGRRDSNPRPPGPQPGALTKLSYGHHACDLHVSAHRMRALIVVTRGRQRCAPGGAFRRHNGRHSGIEHSSRYGVYCSRLRTAISLLRVVGAGRSPTS